jgi:outer membrane receptor protein involved in Fe transport
MSLAQIDREHTTRGESPAARWVACCLLGMVLGFWAGTAKSEPMLSAAIAPQPLAAALSEFAHQTGLQLVYVSQIAAGRTSKGALAGLSPKEALRQLLDGTGLSFEFLNPRTVRIYEAAAVAPAAQSNEPMVAEPRAEHPAAHRLDTLDEILVMGTRREEHVSDVEDVQNIAASVSVVRGDRLEIQKLEQLSDYSAYLPGVGAVGGGSPGESLVVIRGIASITNATSVVYYLDDIPIGPSGHWGFSCCAALDLMPYDLERLEVQRGPQGTLGGAGAEVGSIKYVLYQPSASQFEARLGADVSTIYHGADPGGSVRAMVNVPLVDEQLAVRASAYDSYTPGYIDNAYSGATAVNVLRQYGGRIGTLWRPSESVSVSVNAFWHRIDSASQSEELSPGVAVLPNTGDAYIVRGLGTYGDLTDSAAFLSPFNKDLDAYSATVHWNPGFADVMSVTGWSLNDERYVEDQTAVYGSYFPLLSSGTVHAGVAFSEWNLDLKKLSEELRIVSRLGKRIDWVAGGFYTNERVSNQWALYGFDKAYQPIAAFAPSINFWSIPSTFKERAAFGDVTWKLTEYFDLAGGIRSARDTQSYTSVVGGAGMPTTDESGQSSASVTTWLATARYRITPKLMVYARVATGGQPGAPIGPEYSIQPGVPPIVEKVTTYEPGVKSEFLDRRALVDLSVFYMNWKNIQLPDTNTPTAASYTANGGNATTKGLELTSSFSPFQGLTLGYNAAYTQAAFTGVNPGLQYVLPGYQLSNVPQWAMSLTATYEWMLTADWHAHAGGGCRWVDQEWGSTSTVQSRSLGGAPTVALPSYTALDLNAGAAKGPLSVRLFARNLGDKRAFLQSYVIVDHADTPVQIEHYVLQPRTVGAGFDYAF